VNSVGDVEGIKAAAAARAVARSRGSSSLRRRGPPAASFCKQVGEVRERIDAGQHVGADHSVRDRGALAALSLPTRTKRG
jgi:hypothetical protein